MDISKFIIPLILFAGTLTSGFWVSNSGKPYSTVIVTLHKLIALTGVFFIVLALMRSFNSLPTQPFVSFLFFLAGFSVITLFSSGALLASPKIKPGVWRIVHHASPWLLAGSIVAVFFVLQG